MSDNHQSDLLRCQACFDHSWIACFGHYWLFFARVLRKTRRGTRVLTTPPPFHELIRYPCGAFHSSPVSSPLVPAQAHLSESTCPTGAAANVCGWNPPA